MQACRVLVVDAVPVLCVVFMSHVAPTALTRTRAVLSTLQVGQWGYQGLQPHQEQVITAAAEQAAQLAARHVISAGSEQRESALVAQR